jgi:hypothetical protein
MEVGHGMPRGVVIPLWCGSVLGLGSGVAERQGSWLYVDLAWGCGPVQPEGWRALWSGAAALQSYGEGTWQAGCPFIR